MISSSKAGAPPAGPTQWQQKAAHTLDELKGGACLCLILATLLSVAGVSHGPWPWLCLVGWPAWIGLRSVKLL